VLYARNYVHSIPVDILPGIKVVYSRSSATVLIHAMYVSTNSERVSSLRTKTTSDA